MVYDFNRQLFSSLYYDIRHHIHIAVNYIDIDIVRNIENQLSCCHSTYELLSIQINLKFRDSFADCGIVMKSLLLAHLSLVPHICVRELGQHWFR